MSKDDKIREVLERYGEDMSATWMVQGQRVIYHHALERIAARAGVAFEHPQVLRAQEREAVILVRGRIPAGTNTNPHMFEHSEWSIGEANMELNYRTSGKQQAYPFAMAEKRAKDRVILKLIALHGLVYSEDEADDFKESAPKSNDRRAIMEEAILSNRTVEMEDGEVSPLNAMRRTIDEKTSVTSLTEFMLKPETTAAMAPWSEEDRDNVKAFAREKLLALGWKSAKGPRT